LDVNLPFIAVCALRPPSVNLESAQQTSRQQDTAAYTKAIALLHFGKSIAPQFVRHDLPGLTSFEHKTAARTNS
jgi:hypothetical protein